MRPIFASSAAASSESRMQKFSSAHTATFASGQRLLHSEMMAASLVLDVAPGPIGSLLAGLSGINENPRSSRGTALSRNVIWHRHSAHPNRSVPLLVAQRPSLRLAPRE